MSRTSPGPSWPHGTFDHLCLVIAIVMLIGCGVTIEVLQLRGRMIVSTPYEQVRASRRVHLVHGRWDLDVGPAALVRRVVGSDLVSDAGPVLLRLRIPADEDRGLVVIGPTGAPLQYRARWGQDRSVVVEIPGHQLRGGVAAPARGDGPPKDKLLLLGRIVLGIDARRVCRGLRSGPCGIPPDPRQATQELVCRILRRVRL